MLNDQVGDSEFSLGLYWEKRARPEDFCERFRNELDPGEAGLKEGKDPTVLSNGKHFQICFSLREELK